MSSNTNLTYQGSIVFIGQTEKITDTFSKRLLVISDGASKYPQEIAFEVHKSNCSLLDSYSIGDDIKAHYNMNGRLWKDNKWFNTLIIWKIESANNSQPATNVQAENHNFVNNSNKNDYDDLPF